MTLTGLDILRRDGFSKLRGRSIGVVCNQASIAHDYRHIVELLLPLHASGFLQIMAVFGPEHGLTGHQQDNMIEWEGYTDPDTGLVLHSLYGHHRSPTKEMLDGIDLLVIDLQDVGSRYYTFVSTMKGCLEACEKEGTECVVLDRPNPIGGELREGPTLEAGFESFVGAYPIPIRHGMTIGEIARKFHPNVDVVELEGWDRPRYIDETEVPWVVPSPNMPLPETAAVYPGGCLLEGTNLSEGRGTTRPFEIFGAPFLNARAFSESLNSLNLRGCYFRALSFQPTFNKFSGEVCGGCFLHVSDRSVFEPVLTYCAVMQTAMSQSDKFAWREPPYEYERGRRPIDILAGNDWLADAIESDSVEDLREKLKVN
jgi:uncharacterized protein YbbC (DUF1343 family)